jgi:glycosyltransferase involved in cell wall biosynthesis
MNKKTYLVLIAYNVASDLEEFYRSLPRQLFDGIILVDDASRDGTFELAQRLGIEAYTNKVNLGYGGNLKRALSIALEKGADIIVDLHPDGEYLPSAVGPALKAVENGAQFVLGNRFYDARQPLKSGMHVWKYPIIVMLNLLARLVLRVPCHDIHQGFRVYTRTLLERVPYQNNSDDYLFSFEIIAQAAYMRMHMSEVPVDTRYHGEKRGASLKKSIFYTLGVFRVLGIFILARLGLRTRLFRALIEK